MEARAKGKVWMVSMGGSLSQSRHQARTPGIVFCGQLPRAAADQARPRLEVCWLVGQLGQLEALPRGKHGVLALCPLKSRLPLS